MLHGLALEDAHSWIGWRIGAYASLCFVACKMGISRADADCFGIIGDRYRTNLLSRARNLKSSLFCILPKAT